MLKEIGKRARKDIEGLLGVQVYLELWIKVTEDWRNSPRVLKRSGLSMIFIEAICRILSMPDYFSSNIGLS